MSCCGGKRAQLMQSTPVHSANRIQTSSSQQVAPRYGQKKVARFEHTGSEPFSVHGLVTGKLYSFMAHGTIVEVDVRDVYSLLPFSNLRRLIE